MNKVDNAVNSIGSIFSGILNVIVQLGVAIAFIYFLYGVAMFIFRVKDSPDKMKEGQNHMLYGSFGLTIMLTALAITYFVADSGNKLFLNAGGKDASEGLDKIELRGL